jgi:predicted dienelactone hydrolase
LLLFDAPAYEPGAGKLGIATIEKLDLEDTKRGKTLQLRITYPRQKGPYPVLVFSHGLWGTRNGYRPLVTFWSAHGYVCIQADHADSRALGRMDRTRAFLQWSQRPRDVSFIFDSLAAIEAKAPALKGKLDKTRIGVGGHSYGAHTSQLIGGATARGRSFKDKRVRCVLLLSPQGRGALFGENAWKTMTTPSLVLTGSRDGDPFGDKRKTPEWRLDPYKLGPGPDKYMVWIEDAHHGLGGITGVNWRGAGPKNDDHVKIVQLAGLALFDAYVKENAAAKKWLASDALAKATKAEVKLASGSKARPDPK